MNCRFFKKATLTVLRHFKYFLIFLAFSLPAGGNQSNLSLLMPEEPLEKGLPLYLPIYYWQQPTFVNFGDYLSLKLVERIVGGPVEVYNRKIHGNGKRLLAIGSILSLAANQDVIWGSGVNGKTLDKKHFHFTTLDVRAVRGPLTRKFLLENFNIRSPEIYGDPALLLPYLFPELKKKKAPKYDYLIIPHYSEVHFFPKFKFPNVAYPTDPWDEVIDKILDSKFVISSSLHGIIIAEAFGIPARLLKITYNEPLFKYEDYYLGTNRSTFEYATSVEEALKMGGEKPFKCDLKKLYSAFPFEFWPELACKKIHFRDDP